MIHKIFFNYLADLFLWLFCKQTRFGLLLQIHHEDAEEGIIGWKHYDRNIGVKRNGRSTCGRSTYSN
tara:strand:- start:3460 stop:3660 length:201 start_codon:yes stop_codon:yes gene_type:complete